MPDSILVFSSIIFAGWFLFFVARTFKLWLDLRKYRPLNLNIIKRRRELGLSEQNLADQVNISVSDLRKIEAGEKKIILHVAEKLSEALSATVDYVLGLVKDPSQRLTEEDLTREEQKLLEAWRAGRIKNDQDMLDFIERNG